MSPATSHPGVSSCGMQQLAGSRHAWRSISSVSEVYVDFRASVHEAPEAPVPAGICFATPLSFQDFCLRFLPGRNEKDELPQAGRCRPAIETTSARCALTQQPMQDEKATPLPGCLPNANAPASNANGGKTCMVFPKLMKP